MVGGSAFHPLRVLQLAVVRPALDVARTALSGLRCLDEEKRKRVGKKMRGEERTKAKQREDVPPRARTIGKAAVVRQAVGS